MDDRQDLSSEKVRPLTNAELDAVAGGLANPWLDWIADYFQTGGGSPLPLPWSVAAAAGCCCAAAWVAPARTAAIVSTNPTLVMRFLCCIDCRGKTSPGDEVPT